MLIYSIYNHIKQQNSLTQAFFIQYSDFYFFTICEIFVGNFSFSIVFIVLDLLFLWSTNWVSCWFAGSLLGVCLLEIHLLCKDGSISVLVLFLRHNWLQSLLLFVAIELVWLICLISVHKGIINFIILYIVLLLHV